MESSPAPSSFFCTAWLASTASSTSHDFQPACLRDFRTPATPPDTHTPREITSGDMASRPVSAESSQFACPALPGAASGLAA